MRPEDWERLKNFTIFKVYVTDKERDEILPVAGALMLILFGIAGIYLAIKHIFF